MSGLVIGLDGGNSKTELALATADGRPLAWARGPGTNSHAIGAEGVASVVGRMLEAALAEAGLATGQIAEAAALFCCGADLPADVEALELAFGRRALAAKVLIDNDTFALLYAGRRQGDAVAVVCGAGINAAGLDRRGRTLRYPSLGWESGDWGGSEMLGREALHLAARALDGRGEPTVLPDLVQAHFRASVAEVGAALHYRKMPMSRLGELAPALVEAAADDAVASSLLDRLALEVALLAWRALRDLGLLSQPADVVLGGGMLEAGGALAERARAFLARLAPHAQLVPGVGRPVVGAVVKALELAGAPAAAASSYRQAFTGSDALLVP